MRRSLSSCWRPCAAASCSSRCASNVLPPRAMSKRNSSPSCAAVCVMRSFIASACSRLVPYLEARCSAVEPSRAAGASGSSSNERKVTVTSSACSNVSSAFSKRRLPTAHQGQAMSDQISTFTTVLPIARSTTPQGSLPPVPTVSAAVVQAAPVAFDVEATLEKVERLTAEAAGSDLVVFPEAFVSAYPRGMAFGAVVGSRTDEGRAWFRRYWESSIDVSGPAVDQLGAIAREHGVHLVIGVIERDGGTLYCTALFLSPSGELLGKHRKLMPTGAERLVWGTGDGSTMP